MPVNLLEDLHYCYYYVGYGSLYRPADCEMHPRGALVGRACYAEHYTSGVQPITDFFTPFSGPSEAKRAVLPMKNSSGILLNFPLSGLRYGIMRV